MYAKDRVLPGEGCESRVFPVPAFLLPVIPSPRLVVESN